MRRIFLFSIFNFQFLILFLLASCSTEKAKWKNIQYHNLTTHYNVWWNGNESLKEGRQKLYASVVDDYTQLLPPEPLGTDDNARSIYPEMDRAIEKGIKGIKKHSIFVRGTEHVPYIKECYLLTAYASFYKHDYTSTANTCNILTSQFQGTRAGDEGAVLLARSMTQEKRYTEAENMLDQLVQQLAKGQFSRSQRDKLYIAMVEATVPQGKYKKAVEYIREAIDATSDRQAKARLTFLMAQIYRQLDRRAVAAKYYHQVLRYSPPYVMEFNAKLGEASCADLEHSDIAKLERQLDDLLGDKKNEEYRDQIYFAKGEMYLGMKEPRKACDNYRLSVALAKVNQAQRAQSALRMGEVLYDQFQDYDQAQLYYDTAMQCITRDYPRYDHIRRRHETLTELALYTRTFTRCDSILAVAALPEAERLNLINRQIETYKRQQEEARERELINELLNDSKAQQNTLTGDWYFYNSNTLQKGKETFRQRWGMRALEDMWFLSNKPSMAMLDTDEEQSQQTDQDGRQEGSSSGAALAKGNPNDPTSPAYYLKDLPTTQQQLDSIDSLTSICLLNAGYIYYDGIGNIPRALECYHRLADHYTSYDEVVQAFYMLYRIYDRQGNTPQANYYRDMVLMGFPDSDFANLIRDNEYYKEIIRRDRRIEDDYETLYAQYAARRYTRVIRLADEAGETYAGSPQLLRFDYWKALAQAQTGNRQAAVATLEDILVRCGEADSIRPLAQTQLALLRDTARRFNPYSSDETITEQDERRLAAVAAPAPSVQRSTPEDEADTELPAESQVYRYRENQQYYVVIVVNDRTVKATELQYKIAAFNSQYYSNSGYRINTTLFTDTTQLITIHRFMSAAEALGYWKHLQQDESPLRQLNSSDHQEFPISTLNYATFYNRKDPNAYIPFFRRYYLKESNKNQ
ncbi:MAG: hypothetical protein J6I49_07430 [Bacteroidales bacterium]|nr:hypothetical protein [Bacteroidales bacterium]